MILLVLGGAATAASSPPANPPPELQKARDDLKLSQETRDRIAGESVAALKASGKATAEVIAAYETYLRRVQDMVVENQNLVGRMETAYSAHQAPSPAAAAVAPGAEPGDRVKTLDRQFTESLAAFDELLLKELRILQAASAKRMTGLAEAAAAAGRNAGEKGQGAAGVENLIDGGSGRTRVRGCQK